MAAEATQLRTYQFGPLEKRGFIAGLRLGQIAALVLAIVVAVAALSAGGLYIGFPIALLAILSGAAVAWFQPGGRGIDEWIPVVGTWTVRKFLGGDKWVSPMPLFGTPDKPPKKDRKDKINAIAAPLPSSLAGLTILSVPLDGGPTQIGIIKDNKNGTYTGVLAVRGQTFTLLETTEKERRLESWANVLSGFARHGSVVHRIQWIERSLPDDGDAINRYLKEARVEPDSAPTVRSYVDLLQEYGPVTQQHETYVAIQIHAAKGAAARAIKKSGGGERGACDVLLRELRSLAYQLSDAEILVDGALPPRLVARVVRTAVDPSSQHMLARRGRVNPEDAGVAPENAWPMAVETNWAWLRTDNVFHRTYWIAEWPRLGVGPDFMAPLLLRSLRMRTVALTMEPVNPVRAMREVEQQRTSYLADEQLRQRAGYLNTMRREREMESVTRREAELADGYAELRFSGYVTVTAASLDELDEACSDIEQAAQQSRLELRPLFGEQDFAFTCTLPLARGLRSK